jgi:hypothetical protein
LSGTYPLDTAVDVIVAFFLSNMKWQSANRKTFLLIGHQLLAEKGEKTSRGMRW